MKFAGLMGGLGLAMALGACTPARVALPSVVASSTQPVALTGMGIGRKGRFMLGASSGTFARGASEWSEKPILQPRHTSYRGGGGFTVSGPDFAGSVHGDCHYVEAEQNFGPLSVTSIPFTYRCRFERDGRPIDAEMWLGEVPRSAGPVAAATRAGQMRLGDVTITLKAIHHFEGSALPTVDPVGYRLLSNGRDVGAIDVNGPGKTIYAPRSGAEREAALLAGLSLAVLWRT